MNWGIIGFGEIAPVFIQNLLQVHGQQLRAIASRSSAEMLKRGGQYPSAIIYSDYHDLYDDPEVDIVYVATTHNLHKDNIIDALRAGKHVLSEKPMAVSLAEVAEVVAVARETGKFLMEGMWTRFLPAYREFIGCIEGGKIGNPRMVRASFGFRNEWGEERRLLNKALAGGVVLDVADYCIFLCQDVFKEVPEQVSVVAQYSHTGVEDSCGILLGYPGGGFANVLISFAHQFSDHDAVVHGSGGTIRLRDFWRGTEVALQQAGKGLEVIKAPFLGTGFVHQIKEVARCVAAGRKESCIVPHSLSIEVAGIVDRILASLKRQP